MSKWHIPIIRLILPPPPGYRIKSLIFIGRTGPGDSDIIHDLLFDENGPLAFHSAVHDAFGYLLNYHQTGPGYKYLGAFSIFEAHEPLSDQVSGIEFWNELLRKNKPRKSRLRIY